MTFIVYPRAKQLKRDVVCKIVFFFFLKFFIKNSFQSVLLKNHGEAIKLISIETEKALSTTFRCEIKLKLVVKTTHE